MSTVYTGDTGDGTIDKAAADSTHDEALHGPSHNAPMLTHPSNAIATGPERTNATRRSTPITSLELMSPLTGRRSRPCQGFVPGRTTLLALVARPWDNARK